MRVAATALLIAIFGLALSGCGETAQLPEQASTGPDLTLPKPTESFTPTVHIATAKGWPESKAPKAAAALSVNAFAKNLDHPR
jgi:glucose/arabinose dehydrogenase